ncbi:DUF4245 family protein [Nocardioides marmoriginsengisoli]|nr:DUF4245 family protein [Nocardioides marmoriginsengisoli]
MSQSTSPYAQRSYAGMIGAMIVAVVVAGGWYLIGRPNDDVKPIVGVEWTPQVRAARADGALLIYAPDALPTGWKAREARYLTGSEPSWHLAILTAEGKYVGIDESRLSVAKLVAENVDKNADQGRDVTINGEVWQSWTDSGGDYALTRSVEQGQLVVDSVIVFGSAPDQEIIDFAKTLKTGSVDLTR